jgi:hypothetical protein
MKNTLLVLPVLAATTALAIAGCGGESSSDLAGFAPPGSLVFVEGTVRPTGELESNVNSLAKKVGGVEDLGDLIVEKLEGSASDSGETLDFNKEVKPWLGERAAISFTKLNSDGDLAGYDIALETTNPEATQATIDHQVKINGDPVAEDSYRGVSYWTDTGDDTVMGMIDETFVGAEDAKSFRAAVDASQGEALGDESQFRDAISAASDGSLADAYVDIGGIIDASGDSVDPTAREAFENAGLDPSEATAVASVLPGSDQIEIDVSADTGGETPPSGDASKMLGSLPGGAFAAFASTEFGERLGKALDELDASGIPGKLEPHQLKQGISRLGFDLDKVVGSLEEVGVFASGSDKGSLGGAAVFTTTDSSEVSTAIKTIGLLVRQSGTPGVTALSGKANGFSVRSDELGPKPLVIATKGDRLATGYGLPQTLQALAEESETTLAESPDYQAAVSALGDTPISGYVDGVGALKLAEALVPRSKTGFWEAVPYLEAIRYVGIGSGSDGDLATAKLIVGIQE